MGAGEETAEGDVTLNVKLAEDEKGKAPEKDETLEEQSAKEVATIKKKEDEDKKDSKKKGKKEKPPAAPYGQLFRYADGWDKFMMVIGTICAMGAGAAMPVMSIVFGSVVNVCTTSMFFKSSDIIFCVTLLCVISFCALVSSLVCDVSL